MTISANLPQVGVASQPLSPETCQQPEVDLNDDSGSSSLISLVEFLNLESAEIKQSNLRRDAMRSAAAFSTMLSVGFVASRYKEAIW